MQHTDIIFLTANDLTPDINVGTQCVIEITKRKANSTYETVPDNFV